MLLLDTDTLTIVQNAEGSLYGRLKARLDAEGDDVATSIVSFEEQVRGWLALIARAKRPEQQLVAYRQLHELLADFQTRPVLRFDERALREFARLRREHRRAGSMDLKIAAVAIASDATLVTRNISDFAGIGELRVLDPLK